MILVSRQLIHGGLLNGARQAEVTMNGIGERAGYTSLKRLLWSLKLISDMGLYTNIVSERITAQSVGKFHDAHAGAG